MGKAGSLMEQGTEGVRFGIAITGGLIEVPVLLLGMLYHTILYNKKTRILRDRKDWIITPAPHLKIIDDALWARVKMRQAVIHNESAAVRAALKLCPTISSWARPKISLLQSLDLRAMRA